jgi:hypothetical protein
MHFSTMQVPSSTAAVVVVVVVVMVVKGQGEHAIASEIPDTVQAVIADST